MTTYKKRIIQIFKIFTSVLDASRQIKEIKKATTYFYNSNHTVLDQKLTTSDRHHHSNTDLKIPNELKIKISCNIFTTKTTLLITHLLSQANCLNWHKFPVYPNGHTHTNELTVASQLPPFEHGLPKQLSIIFSHLSPT